MRRLLLAALAALSLCVPVAASAQATPLSEFVLTDSAAHPIVAVGVGVAPGVTGAAVVGAANLGTAAQTATVTCYDNASAASGKVVLVASALGINGSVTLPLGGLPLQYGLTCVASGVPSGSGIAVYYTTY